MMRKDLIVAVIATFCLTATLFWVVPTRSQYKNDEYNPWVDYDENGKINILDITNVSIAFGTTGTPINKTAILLDLQNRVNALEEEASQTRWIRFYDPTEYLSSMNDPLGPKDIVTFVWTPNNTTNNAILSIRCYFQHYKNDTDMLLDAVYFQLKIDGRETAQLYTDEDHLHVAELEWSRVFWDYDFRGGQSANQLFYIPNSANHTITFQLYDVDYEITAHVKDINILIEVMDGLPPEN